MWILGTEMSRLTLKSFAAIKLCSVKDLFSYASEYVRQFNELDQWDRHDLWDGMDLSEI